MSDESELSQVVSPGNTDKEDYGPGRPRSPSPLQLRRLFDHERWLRSGGRFGRRLELIGTLSGNLLVLKRLDLKGVDLSRAVLVNVEFRQAALNEARFIEAELRSVTFFGCDVEAADFSGAKLEQVSFEKSNHRQAHFDNVNTEHVYWNGEHPVYRQRIPRNSPKL